MVKCGYILAHIWAMPAILVVKANQKCPHAGNLEMPYSADKVASLGFSWKFNLHSLLVNPVA